MTQPKNLMEHVNIAFVPGIMHATLHKTLALTQRYIVVLSLYVSQPVVVCRAGLECLHPEQKLRPNKDAMHGTTCRAAPTVHGAWYVHGI